MTTSTWADATRQAETYDTREAWLQARRSAITATDAPVLLGLSRWSSPFALYAAKLGLVEADAESEAMRWGITLEPLVADRYQDDTGRRMAILLECAPWALAMAGRLHRKRDRFEEPALVFRFPGGNG